MRTFGSISTLLCLLLSTACSTTRTVTKPEVLELRPPAALLQPCTLPEVASPRTNGELVDGYLEWRRAARECAAEKQAIVDWAKEITSSSK